MIKILIDADMFAYISAASVEREIDWGNGIWTLHADVEEAKAVMLDKLDYAVESALRHLKYSGQFEVIFCLSDSENFRKKILPSYKANRIGKRKPCCYKGLVEYIKENFTTYQRDTLEADDCIGILATIKQNKGKAVIISGDKDFKSIPAYVYNFLSNEFVNVSEADADRWFLTQCLTGDTADNYTGLPKCGKVGAARILDKDCSWDAVVEAYTKQGFTKNDALIQARVARILRATDYDFKRKQVKLWDY